MFSSTAMLSSMVVVMAPMNVLNPAQGGEFLKAWKVGRRTVKSNRFLEVNETMSRLPHGCNVMRYHKNRLVLIVAKSVKKFEKRIS